MCLNGDCESLACPVVSEVIVLAESVLWFLVDLYVIGMLSGSIDMTCATPAN